MSDKIEPFKTLQEARLELTTFGEDDFQNEHVKAHSALRALATLETLYAEIARLRADHERWLAAGLERGHRLSEALDEVIPRGAPGTVRVVKTSDAPEIIRALEQRVRELEVPIPMILHCPRCGMQHVDEANPKKNWDNPPHKTHQCQECGGLWRPAMHPTNGVASINHPEQVTETEIARLRAALGSAEDFGEIAAEASGVDNARWKAALTEISRLQAALAKAPCQNTRDGFDCSYRYDQTTPWCEPCLASAAQAKEKKNEYDEEEKNEHND